MDHQSVAESKIGSRRNKRSPFVTDEQMAANNKQLVEQICAVPPDKRCRTWFDRLSAKDRQLTEAVLQHVISQQLSSNTVARELKRHIDCKVSPTTIAKWMRAHAKD